MTRLRVHQMNRGCVCCRSNSHVCLPRRRVRARFKLALRLLLHDWFLYLGKVVWVDAHTLGRGDVRLPCDKKLISPLVNAEDILMPVHNVIDRLEEVRMLMVLVHY